MRGSVGGMTQGAEQLAAANAARRRGAEEKRAAYLREGRWVCLAPDHPLYTMIRQQLRARGKDLEGR